MVAGIADMILLHLKFFGAQDLERPRRVRSLDWTADIDKTAIDAAKMNAKINLGQDIERISFTQHDYLQDGKYWG